MDIHSPHAVSATAPVDYLSLPAAERRRPYQITAAGLEFLYQRLTESARIAEVGLRTRVTPLVDRPARC